MAAPDHVPIRPTDRVRTYASPPRRPGTWAADRPGELSGDQPSGPRLGTTGPDQGYAFTLVDLFADKLHLGEVSYEDVVAGCVAVAMRRAGLFGRAPVVHDLTVAFTIFGFLDEHPSSDLETYRNRAFAEVRSSHHYSERRQIVDAVLEETLRLSHSAVTNQYHKDWRSSLTL